MIPHILLITVAAEQLDVDRIETKLNDAKDWLRYAPGCWLVYTRQTADTWYERLADVVSAKGTQVFICEVNLEERSGRLSPSAWSWIKNVRSQVAKIISSRPERQVASN